MIRLFLSLIILIPLLVQSQYYQPFNGTSSLLLYSNSSTNAMTFGVAFDSVKQVGAEQHFYPYMQPGSQYQTSVCPYWGNPFCIIQDKPGWLGRKIIATSDQRYGFIRKGNDTVWLDLGLGLQDSSLVYKDTQQKIWMKYHSVSQDSVAGTQDSVRVFLLKHYDMSGQVISQGYHNDSILLGKTSGLLQVMQLDTVPAKLPMLKLIAHDEKAFGLTQITEASLHDHQVGDEIQYHDYFFSYSPSPFLGHNKIIRDFYLQRIDSQNDVTYLIRREEFEMGASTMTVDTISQTYSKTQLFASLPYDRINQNGTLESTRIQKEDYCGIRRWTYITDPIHPYYFCQDERSWCVYDYGGPPPNEKYTYVVGLGLYEYDWNLSNSPSGGHRNKKIIYYKKDGIDCGNGTSLDHHIDMPSEDDITIYPNPADAQFNILFQGSSAHQWAGRYIEIFNTTGTLMIREQINHAGPSIQINTSGLSQGIYYLRLTSKDGSITKKLVIR